MFGNIFLVLKRGAVSTAGTLWNATLATARRWTYILTALVGIAIGHFGPGLYLEYAPWAPSPEVTRDHAYVGLPVYASDSRYVGTVSGVIPIRGKDAKTADPQVIEVYLWRVGFIPQTRRISRGLFKRAGNRIALGITRDKYLERPTESWRPKWWQKNYWPPNWT